MKAILPSRLPRLFTMCLALCSVDAMADKSTDDEHSASNEVYESLDDVSIGKVFFSSTERERLERRRGSTPRMNVTRSKTSQASTGSKNAAGYIVSRGGVAKVYKGRDFVTLKSLSRGQVPFPGTVKIERGVSIQASEPGDADQ